MNCYLIFTLVWCPFLFVVSDLSIETLVHCQAHGLWKNDLFILTTIKPYNKTYFTGNNKPRILMIGDSVNRNAVRSYCKSVKNSIYGNYTSCISPGGHFSCISNEVELASFFIFGSSLYSKPYGTSSTGFVHFCPNMPYSTLDRIRNHLLPSVRHVYGNNTIDIILINTIRWGVRDVSNTTITFNTNNFTLFAQEYIHNMTLIIKEVRILFPTSIILLHTIPYVKSQSFLLSKMNMLLNIIAIQNRIGMYEISMYTILYGYIYIYCDIY